LTKFALGSRTRWTRREKSWDPCGTVALTGIATLWVRWVPRRSAFAAAVVSGGLIAGANPRAWGTLESSADGGTLITATFPRDIWQRILLVPVVFVAIAFIVGTNDPNYRAVELFLLIALVLIGLAPGGLGKRQVRELLQDIAKPTTSSQPWRPYAGRDGAGS